VPVERALDLLAQVEEDAPADAANLALTLLQPPAHLRSAAGISENAFKRYLPQKTLAERMSAQDGST
jgi:hypothetical protein